MSTTPEAPVLPEHIGEVETGWKCTSCEAVTTEDSDTPLYECDDDGPFAGDEGNRCPQCNKFASRSEDGNACEECNEGALEPVEVRHCTNCDTTFEVGDEDDHEHDDDDEGDEPGVDEAGLPTGGTRRERMLRATYPVPVLVPKPARDLAVGDRIAEAHYTDGRKQAALTGEAPPFYYTEARQVRVLDDRVEYGEHGVTRHVPPDEIIQTVTGWERPPGAVEIAARDLTISMLICDPADWEHRSGVCEVTHNRLDDTVVAKHGMSVSRRDAPTTTYAGGDLLTVVDLGKPNRFGGKTAWRITLATPLRRLYAGLDSEPDPQYEGVTVPVLAALKATGIDLDGRKVIDRTTGGGRNAEAYLTIIDKHRALADAAVEVFERHGQTVKSRAMTSVDR